MLASGLKYELDALANKGFRYLPKTYLRKADFWCIHPCTLTSVRGLR